jgi:hypothetical protein
MKSEHPKSGGEILAIALAALIGGAGCQSQPTAMNSPFLAPDRVPPPATRTLLPGTAQPYYPGDPLPAMQSDARGGNDARSGGWALAGSSARIAAEPQQPVTMTSPTEAARPALARANEPTIAIPSDDASLRFASIASHTAVPSAAAAAAAPPAHAPVTSALYFEPVPNQAVSPTAASSGPWRSPQLPQSGVVAGPVAAVPMTTQPFRVAAAPAAGPAGSTAAAPPAEMSVRIRAVPSPDERIGSPTPRIRLPGYSPSAANSQAGAVQQAGYVVSTAGADSTVAPGVIQTVQIAPLAPIAFVSPPAGGGDGFRPRGSMR